MMNNNLYISCKGYLCTNWHLGKKYFVNTIAVHISKEKTEFIDLICNEKKVLGDKGDYLEVYGLPLIQVYKGKGKYMIFVDTLHDGKQK